MQQTDSTFKYVQLWNDQNLDTQHDIIISFNYSLFNYNDIPTCGFCVALFESISDKPRGGGPNYSLAYTPNDTIDNCNPRGYSGLEHAIYGIGFDINGVFAKANQFIDGVDYTISNAICIRGGVKDNYSFLHQTQNLLYPYDFEIAQQLVSQDEKVIYKQIRMVFSKCMSNFSVEVKNENEKNFIKILEKELPILDKKNLKIGLFYTSLDQNTRFNLKEFNVAGFPSILTKKQDPTLSLCYQEIQTQSNVVGNKLPSNKEWIVVPSKKDFNFYKFNGKEYTFKRTIRGTGDQKILNYNDNFVFFKTKNKLDIYKYLGNDFAKQYTISLPTTADITSCAGYNDTLVISSSSQGEPYFVYKYIKESEDFSKIGNWELYQTFNYSLCSGFGTNVEISENYIVSYSNNNFIVSFKKDDNLGYYHHQTILPPFTAAKGFGEAISIDNDIEMIVGAPFGGKRFLENDNQGEAFHYVVSPFTGNWTLISEIGNYYNIDTSDGNFGYSVKLKNNVAIIGSPFESYYTENTPPIEVQNQGKAYVFKKNEFGYFIKNTILYPQSFIGDSKKNFGYQVNIIDNFAMVSKPFDNNNFNTTIDVYDLNCPPKPIPIPKPSPTPSVTPTLTPTLTPTPTPTSTPTYVSLVTIFDEIPIFTFEGVPMASF
jgi:hypothetical protein